jgi:hypothetical protein
MSGLRPDLAFTQREADNPDAVSDNSDERGVGRSEKSFPNRRPAFRAGKRRLGVLTAFLQQEDPVALERLVAVLAVLNVPGVL